MVEFEESRDVFTFFNGLGGSRSPDFSSKFLPEDVDFEEFLDSLETVYELGCFPTERHQSWYTHALTLYNNRMLFDFWRESS